eukprot:gene17388-biopygen9857
MGCCDLMCHNTQGTAPSTSPRRGGGDCRRLSQTCPIPEYEHTTLGQRNITISMQHHQLNATAPSQCNSTISMQHHHLNARFQRALLGSEPQRYHWCSHPAAARSPARALSVPIHSDRATAAPPPHTTTTTVVCAVLVTGGELRCCVLSRRRWCNQYDNPRNQGCKKNTCFFLASRKKHVQKKTCRGRI